MIECVDNLEVETAQVDPVPLPRRGWGRPARKRSRSADLFSKPLDEWTVDDLKNSIGNWSILRFWPKPQLRTLLDLYRHAWPNTAKLSRIQAAWIADVTIESTVGIHACYIICLDQEAMRRAQNEKKTKEK